MRWALKTMLSCLSACYPTPLTAASSAVAQESSCDGNIFLCLHCHKNTLKFLFPIQMLKFYAVLWQWCFLALNGGFTTNELHPTSISFAVQKLSILAIHKELHNTVCKLFFQRKPQFLKLSRSFHNVCHCLSLLPTPRLVVAHTFLMTPIICTTCLILNHASIRITAAFSFFVLHVPLFSREPCRFSLFG